MQMTFGPTNTTQLKCPMKGPGEPITDDQLKDLTYPVVCSPKLDGIRAIVLNGIVLSNSMKEIPNNHIQRTLSKYEGFDGELIVGDPTHKDCFNITTGAVRKKSGRPQFTFYVFDNFIEKDVIYTQRYLNTYTLNDTNVVSLDYKICKKPEHVLQYEKCMLERGFEGIMIRDPNGLYKDKRCTFNEGTIFKRKPVSDDEATIIDILEQHDINGNPKDTFGAFVLQNEKWTFNCGTGQGLTHELREHIWKNRKQFIGRTVTYKYQSYGSINSPRLPIFKGFREEFDISEY